MPSEAILWWKPKTNDVTVSLSLSLCLIILFSVIFLVKLNDPCVCMCVCDYWGKLPFRNVSFIFLSNRAHYSKSSKKAEKGWNKKRIVSLWKNIWLILEFNRNTIDDILPAAASRSTLCCVLWNIFLCDGRIQFSNSRRWWARYHPL